MIKKLLLIILILSSSLISTSQNDAELSTSLPKVLIDDHSKIVGNYFITVRCSFKIDSNLTMVPFRNYVKRIPLKYVFKKDGTINIENNYEIFTDEVKFQLIIETTKQHIKDFYKSHSIIKQIKLIKTK